MENSLQRAVLAAVDFERYDIEDSLDELEELARTAGAEVVARLVQKRPELDKATAIGEGKVEELRSACEALEADLVIFDHELSPSQLRNLEDALGVSVVDRTMLILDIFASRALTAEGKLQVELAQQKYLMPRLMGLGKSLSRLGGGIGTRGPGETKLEVDRRHIRSRIEHLKDELKELQKRRLLLRERRKKDGVITIAIVGYTNVGKSTLLNRLTNAGVLSENKLFATLDLTSRGYDLPDGRQVLFVDTVGLIRRLPHHLVEAFKCTLEEAKSADLILNVADSSSPDLTEQLEVTVSVLNDIGAGDIKRLTVLNKFDLAPKFLPVTPNGEDVVAISALTGEGIDTLISAVQKALTPTHTRLTATVPYSEGALLSLIRETGKIYSEQYTDEGYLIDAFVDNKILHRLEKFYNP